MSTATSAADISQAASAFIDALSDEQRQRTIYDFMDGERIFWYYPARQPARTPPARHER